MEIDELVLRAERRGGLLTVADLDAAGLSAGGIQRAVGSGQIVRLRRGVFSTSQILEKLAGDRWRRHALDVKAALAVAGDTAVATGASAAALHGLAMIGDPPMRPILTRPVEVSACGKRSVSTVGRVARLPESHLTRLSGWPATDVARTVIDVARRQGERYAVVVGDSALGAGLETAEIDRVLADCSGAPGIQSARESLALCDGRAESPLESLVRLALHRGAIPPPQLQAVIGPYRVDFCWPWARLILEADGRLKYLGPADLFAEKKREDWLRSQGYAFLRTDWAEAFGQPLSLCDRVARSLTAAAA